MDTRDQHQNDELMKFKEQLKDKQKIINDQNNLVEEMLEENSQAVRQTEKQTTDPYWEKSVRGDDHCQQGRVNNGQTKIVTTGIPNFAIGITQEINKAIDLWIDDCQIHGGIISDRNMVNSQIVPGWGVRVRRRLLERNVDGTDKVKKDLFEGGKGHGYQTLINRIRQVIRSPETYISVGQSIGELNNIGNATNKYDEEDLDDDDDGDGLGDQDNTENTHVEIEYTETMIDTKNFDLWTSGVLL